MTNNEAREFYKRDKQLYNLDKNKNFLFWCKENLEKGYNKATDIEDMQGLINTIALWYTLKYPDLEFDKIDEDYDPRFDEIEEIPINSDFMDINQLFYRLTYNELAYLKCLYVHPKAPAIQMKNEPIGEEVYASKVIYNYLKIDAKTGIIKYFRDNYGKDINSGVNTVEEIYCLLNEHKEYDCRQLGSIVYDHKIDIELRDTILYLVALKLLYADHKSQKDFGRLVNTIPEHGYERAKRFINEFNEELNLNLSTDGIDEIFNSDYAKDNDNKENDCCDFYLSNTSNKKVNDINELPKELKVREKFPTFRRNSSEGNLKSSQHKMLKRSTYTIKKRLEAKENARHI